MKRALGWLDWPPDTVLNTPIPLIELAITGKAEFIRNTSPFVKRDEEDEEDDGPSDPEEAAAGFIDFLTSHSKGRPPP